MIAAPDAFAAWLGVSLRHCSTIDVPSEPPIQAVPVRTHRPREPRDTLRHRRAHAPAKTRTEPPARSGSTRFQAQRQQRGLIPAYSLCGGYVASGATVCPSPRIPTTYLEDAASKGSRSGWSAC